MTDTYRTSKLKGRWIARMRCSVVKDVILENCTEEEARSDPWEYAVDEHEVEQYDWEITRLDNDD